jgi:4-carboxymuconolactone decarboxylase
LSHGGSHTALKKISAPDLSDNHSIRQTPVNLNYRGNTMDTNERFNKGFENRKEVLGAAHVEKSWANADDFNRPMQKFVTESCWGDIWGDPTLSFKTRSMLNLGMLTAMSQHHELSVHVKGALRNGVSKEEVRAVLMQAAVYCGAPLALAAFRVASEAIKAYDAEATSA